ncbi:hypothetical protein [uncultured Paracoccus sp.]|uniref:hypothetical protein n=1 Tax=uncultured Paracoccus sp. TaxID=189685 RepID=UPI002632133A|nr:hypothetical protein [uncultured Paracoccus sp.]
MRLNIRYRLIQIVEFLLWLGAAAGLGQIASRLWNMRDQGWRAMLDVAVPGLLGIGAGMAGLIVLIGIYHNTRRNADAMERLAKQGAGTMRRLPGAARAEVAAAAAQPVQPVPVTRAAVPVAPPEPAPVIPDVVPEPLPEPVMPQTAAPSASAPVLRGNTRRLGPAS